MKLVRNIVIGVVGVLALVMVIGLFLPRNVSVERSVVIDAPPEAVFARVNSLSGFNDWSPWYGRDPDALYAIEGPESGVGSKMSWKSDQKDVGSGTLEIVESRAPEYVESALDFGRQGGGIASFTLEPAGEAGTEIRWSFSTDMGANPLARYFGLMMDSYIGPDYETGLAKLKDVVEAEAASS